MGETTFGEAPVAAGPAARPLLSPAARPLAVTAVIVCGLVTAMQGVWLRHGMETGWLDATVDAKVRSVLGGQRALLSVLVWPGERVPVAVMAAALVLAGIARRRYRKAALVAISIPLATAVTELVLKPLIGRTPWGDPFPSGHVTSITALAAAVMVLLTGTPVRVPSPLRYAAACTALLIVAAVALGVIGANMHHLSDTVGGAAVGAGTVLLTALTLDLACGQHAQRRPRAGEPVRLAHGRAAVSRRGLRRR
jgi:membrane-associated phospholipid phosphatase